MILPEYAFRGSQELHDIVKVCFRGAVRNSMALSKYAFRDSQDLHDIVKERIEGGQEPFDIAKVCLLAQPGTI